MLERRLPTYAAAISMKSVCVSHTHTCVCIPELVCNIEVDCIL